MTHPIIESFECTGCGGLWDHEIDSADPSVAQELRIWREAWAAAIREAINECEVQTIIDQGNPSGLVGKPIIDRLRALEFAPLCDVEYPHHAPNIAIQARPLGDDDQASKVELLAQALRLRVALLHCKSLAERMRGGMRWSWENKDAEAIADTVDDALSETE